jgi:hypothetical protein
MANYADESPLNNLPYHATANLSGAPPSSSVFPWQILSQTYSPKTVPFHNKYQFHSHARYLQLGESSTDSTRNTSPPIGCFLGKF